MKKVPDSSLFFRFGVLQYVVFSNEVLFNHIDLLIGVLVSQYMIKQLRTGLVQCKWFPMLLCFQFLIWNLIMHLVLAVLFVEKRMKFEVILRRISKFVLYYSKCYCREN